MFKMRNGHFKKLFFEKNDFKKTIQVIAEQVPEFEEENTNV